MADFIVKLIGTLLRALIEDFLLWPFPKRGQSFVDWWNERSIPGKCVAVLLWVFWIVVLTGVIAVIVQHLVK